MKNQILILFMCVLPSCNTAVVQAEQWGTMIILVGDRSDRFEVYPLAEPILALYKFDENKDKAATFRHVVISDMRLNPIQEFYLPSSIEAEKLNVREEVNFRDRLIHSFYDSVRNEIVSTQTGNSVPESLEHSQCFAVISNELAVLMSRKANERILIVYSDLMENSTFNCYSDEGQALLASTPDKVGTLLNEQTPLPESLNGVTIYFVYRPETIKADALYARIIAVYKSLLTSRGAKVHVSATNKYYEQ